MSDDGPITHTVFGETVSVCQACGMAVFGEHRFCGECEGEDSSTDDDTWTRNSDRWYYDRGYSLGATETKRDATVPRLIGYGSLFAGTLWDPLITGTFLGVYAAFALLDYRDRRDEAEHKRDVHDPGPEWEGMRRDPDDA